MRDRPFLSASESPRPFGDVLDERRAMDPVARSRDAALDRVAALERAAADETDAEKRKALLCDAEAIRCAVDGR